MLSNILACIMLFINVPFLKIWIISRQKVFLIQIKNGFLSHVESRFYRFFNLSLYRYTLGREGQTMDWGTLCRNIGMIENIVMQMLIRLTDYKNDISVCRRKYVENVLQVQIELIYRVELLSKRKELCNIEILNKIDKMIFLIIWISIKI